VRDEPSVLFVGVHNAGRSRMAAGWLRHLAARQSPEPSATAACTPTTSVMTGPACRPSHQHGRTLRCGHVPFS
jgi:arsenate reductase (thioredoxin)